MLASRALVGVAARSLATLDPAVTLPQYRMLVLLHTHGDQNVGALADALGIHPSSATRLCDRMARKGLVVRSPSPTSRREVTVAIARGGRAVVRSVTERRLAEIEHILAGITETDRERLIDALAVFATAADELPDDAWRLGWSA